MLPQALAIGVSYDDFWKLNPRKVKVLYQGYYEARKMRDQEMWHLGLYINSAVTVAIDHCLNGKKATSEYIKEPILSRPEYDATLTEEERIELEMRKAIAIEEQWIQNDKRRGLPQTTIA